MHWWKSIFSMELRKILAYRTDFWITFIGQVLIQYFVATSLWESIFSHQKTESLKGLNFQQISLVYFMIPIINRILTGENIGFLSREIYEGTFNKYLIYPLSFFQYKAITYFTHSFFYLLQFLIGVSLYLFINSDTNLSFGSLISSTPLLLTSALLFMCMSFCLELVALWADNVWSLMLVLRFLTSFLGGGFLPLRFFPSWAQEILIYTPFPYLIDFPIKIILGEMHLSEIERPLIILISWILFFMTLMNLIWKRGQKTYSGVGI